MVIHDEFVNIKANSSAVCLHLCVCVSSCLSSVCLCFCGVIQQQGRYMRDEHKSKLSAPMSVCLYVFVIVCLCVSDPVSACRAIVCV